MEDRWKTSRAMLARAQKSLIGGVNSFFRAKAPVPLYFEDGSGCRIQDVDGNAYIDYSLAWGPLILGHRHPSLVQALRHQAERPHHYGAQHELEIQVSERFQALVPCGERVIFCSSGSEAVQLALRLARAFTRRNLIVKFEGHYHGWMDSVLLSYDPAAAECGDPDRPAIVPGSRGQVPNAVENVIVAPWNRLAPLETIFRERGQEIAGVITEPVLCNSGGLLPLPGYLEGVRDLCRKYGSLLIFDEVITGFRMSLGGAQEFYRLTPDIATFGKALGGGLPLSAAAGRKEIFELLCDRGVAFGGTFNGNPVSMAAANATLGELSKCDGELLLHANRMGEKLMHGIRAVAERYRIPVAVTGFGAAFSVHFNARSELQNYRDTLDDDARRLKDFVSTALAEGLYLLPDGRVYVSAVHTESDIEETLASVTRIFRRVQQGS